jgi:hypothetical protein
MSTAFSVAEVLDKLEKRLAHHRERADFHAQQEIHHRERSAFHLAELERVSQHFEAFKATALTAADLAGELAAPAPPAKEEPEDDREFIGKRVQAAKLVARVVDRIVGGATFGAAQVAAEVNRRYRDLLRRPVDARAVSVTLRRLRDAGRLRLVRAAKANQEGLYVKAAKAAAPTSPGSSPA